MAEPEKTIAYTCPYVPSEWIAAHGLRPQRLIPWPAEGATMVPRLEGLCPYARAFANEAAISRDIAGIVVTTLCDQMRRVFDLLVRRVETPAFLLNVPCTWQTVASQRLYLDELKRLGRFLVRLGGHEPTKEDLTHAMLDQTGPEFRLQAGKTSPTRVNAELRTEGVPLAVVGGPLMQRDQVLFDLVADCGGSIVLDATETGVRGRHVPFNRRWLAEDPLMELAQVYFSIPDAGRRPNSELYLWLKEQLERTAARGILFHHYVWCDKWHAEFTRLRDWTTLPVLRLDSEGDGAMDTARVRTRIRAFLETFV